MTGEATLSRDFTKLSESDLQIGEAIGIPIALVILLAVFGTVVAALVPLVLAIFAIIVALALAALIGQISPLSFFVVNMLTFMGLAVGIDYSLFIVSRYREERARGHEQLDAIAGRRHDRKPCGAVQRHDGGARARGDADRARRRSSSAWQPAPSSRCSWQSWRH